MNKKITQILSFSIALSLSAAAQASNGPSNPIDDSTPYIDPGRECITSGMVNPPGKEYRYLFSRDCRVVHVLPPAVMKQNIKGQGVNLQACAAMRTALDSNAMIETLIQEGQARLRKYEKQLEAATSKSEQDRLGLAIKQLDDRLKGYTTVRDESAQSFDAHYAQVPGAVFSIVMDGGVSPTDLNEIRGSNQANLYRMKTVEKHTIDAAGKDVVTTTNSIEESALRAAVINSSIYSFIYSVPKEAGQNGGLISTDIPSLQYLAQAETHTGVLHVKANGGISGRVVMSLTTACDKTRWDEQGQLQLKDDVDPIFTVNRTLEVQEKFSQGYVATFNVAKAVEQLTSYTETHTEQGFQKSSVFAPSIAANVDEILDFHWDTGFNNGQATTLKEIRDIKTAIAVKFVDDYIESLQKAGVITVQPDKATDPAKGGYEDQTRVANRCWTESDGGLSGFVGNRHNVCADFTYVVKVWHNGITHEEIKRNLTVNVSQKETMTVDLMTPFYFTTAFVK